MKKWFSVLLTVAVLAGVLCGCGKGKESPVEDFDYEMIDGEAVITGYHGADREIYIPSEINGRKVTVIGEKAFAKYDLTLVDIPESVKVIGQGAFDDCNCLVKVNLPKSLERIEGKAFHSCDALAEINLPGGLQFLGHGSFSDCAEMKELVLPDDFAGFEMIEVMIVGGWQKEIWSPLGENNNTTELVVQADSEALRLILEYGYGEINYTVVGSSSDVRQEN